MYVVVLHRIKNPQAAFRAAKAHEERGRAGRRARPAVLSQPRSLRGDLSLGGALGGLVQAYVDSTLGDSSEKRATTWTRSSRSRGCRSGIRESAAVGQ